MKTNYTTINQLDDSSWMVNFDSRLDPKFLKEVADFIRRAANAYIVENVI